MEQRYVDQVVRAVLDQRAPTILEVDEIPPFWEPGSMARVMDTGETILIQDLDRDTNELAIQRFPRG